MFFIFFKSNCYIITSHYAHAKIALLSYMFIFTISFGKELQKLCYIEMKLIFLGVVFLATVSSIVFSPTTIVSRNCTHISFKTKINPDRRGLIFFWRAVIINGTSSVTVSKL